MRPSDYDTLVHLDQYQEHSNTQKNRNKKIKQRAQKHRSPQDLPVGMVPPDPKEHEQRDMYRGETPPSHSHTPHPSQHTQVPSYVDPNIISELCTQVMYLTRQMDQLVVYIDKLEKVNAQLTKGITHMKQQNMVQGQQIQELYRAIQMKMNPSYGNFGHN
eukprot:TRINITY_DN13297_c0_g1_i1.p1 TRINITY_DN13297_c0_g1~~TRINITY_DN13297_c0_g1_i1.p1  ORF type:complete len:160 (+),score=27.37 TRINITY_DN13297_c0_g1_i1:102-581(+)